MGAIELRGIGRTFNKTTAVADIDLTIDDGDFLVLLGPSGCGKTTLLRMIAGLLEPTSGTISLDGTDITHLPPKKRDLAMVFQSYALYPHLSVRKNLGFPLRIQKLDKADAAARVESVAEMLEIDHLLERRPKELSGGQRQRVAVGRALVRNPKAFLMDEPLSNLDAKLRTATRRELSALHQRLGATFVYVTHDQIEAMTMATRIVVLNAGSIEQVGTPAEVYDRPASVFVAGFIGSPAMNLIDAVVRSDNRKVLVEAPGVSGVLWDGDTPTHDVVLGIRPEHLSIVGSDAVATGISITCTVSLVENLGNEQIVTCSTGEHDVQARAPRTAEIVPGASVELTADPGHLHLFDRDSGRRMEWVPDAAPASPAPLAAAV